MIGHQDALRLAATAIDFPLSPRDGEALHAHLDACSGCRRDATAIRATARDLASIAVRPAPDRVRAAVVSAAVEPTAVQFRALTVGFPEGLPFGFAALLLVAVLVALLVAGLIAGAPRTPFRAEVPTNPAAPSTGPVAIQLQRAPSLPAAACASLRSFTVAGGEAWWTCPDGTLWSGLADAQVADGVQAVVPGAPVAVTRTQTVWELSANHLDEFNATSTARLRTVNGVGGTAAAASADGTTLAVVDATGGVVRWLDTRSATPTVVGTTTVGSGPTDIVIAFNSAWVSLPEAGKVVRVDAATHRISATITVGQEPRTIVAGADRVWVADDGDGTVAAIDPATNTPTLVEVDPTADSSLLPGITVAPDGSVWVADSHRQELVRLDPLGHGPLVHASIALAGGVGPIVARGGSIWVVDTGGDPPNDGAVVEFLLPAASGG